MRILTASQIRKVENLCFERYSTEAELMLKAGTACAESMFSRYGEEMKNESVSVLCGAGKNAGDGFVIARLLYAWGVDVKIVLCKGEPEIAEPVMYFMQAVRSGVPVEDFCADSLNCGFVVDCMFGIGFHGDAREPFDKIFELVNKSGATVISVDTPSGTDSESGAACKNCIKADYTIAISTLKFAHVLPPANAFCGEVETVNIGITEDCYEDEYITTITPEYVSSIFAKRDKNSNKGTFGHQLNICGSYSMFGAAVISAESALRSGVGLLKLVIPESAYPLAASHLTQPIFKPVAQTLDGTFSADITYSLKSEFDWASAILFGCGVGDNDDTRIICDYVLKNAKCPVVIDADGINCLSRCINIIKDIKAPAVLTPHPGEMARLVSKTVAEIQNDRINIAKGFAKENNIVLVLKGANTIVTDGKSVFVNVTGNPGMAMGGTGDMLSGIIASFIAQGASPLDAAAAGVYLHGLCGDEAAKRVSQRGMTVSDMTELLGVLMSNFE